MVQSDGKVVVAGRFATVRGPLDGFLTVRNRIARFNTDGSLDRTYDPNINSEVTTLALQSDGKVLVGGAFTKMVWPLVLVMSAVLLFGTPMMFKL